MSWYSGLFSSTTSSGGGSSSGAWGDIFKAVLGGVSAYSSSRSADKTSKNNTKDQIKLLGLQGIEARKTTQFEKELERYYSQLDKRDKRVALDTYGAFSKLGTYAPNNYTLPAVPVVPTKPVAG